jgi:hypothetical protein
VEGHSAKKFVSMSESVEVESRRKHGKKRDESARVPPPIETTPIAGDVATPSETQKRRKKSKSGDGSKQQQQQQGNEAEPATSVTAESASATGDRRRRKKKSVDGDGASPTAIPTPLTAPSSIAAAKHDSSKKKRRLRRHSFDEMPRSGNSDERATASADVGDSARGGAPETNWAEHYVGMLTARAPVSPPAPQRPSPSASMSDEAVSTAALSAVQAPLQRESGEQITRERSVAVRTVRGVLGAVRMRTTDDADDADATPSTTSSSSSFAAMLNPAQSIRRALGGLGLGPTKVRA